MKLSYGEAEKDRISFYTKKNSVTAIRNEDGNISLKIKNEGKDFFEIIALLGMVYYTFSFFKLLLFIPFIKNNHLDMVAYFLPLIAGALLMVLKIIDGRKSEGIECLRNHAAEHMVLAAYRALGKVPTLAEAKRFSRISKSCGITIYTAYITNQIIGFIIYYYTNLVIIPELLVLVATFFLHRYFPFNLIGLLIQFIATKKPNDSNIELAIAAISTLENQENSEEISSANADNTSKN